MPIFKLKKRSFLRDGNINPQNMLRRQPASFSSRRRVNSKCRRQRREKPVEFQLHPGGGPPIIRRSFPIPETILMSLLDKLLGEFIDVIEWTEPSQNDILAYRFPRYHNEIKNGAQLTVREGQAAAFVSEGRLADVFMPGMYRLETRNLPILSTLQGWKYGFDSPFRAEVYFISTRQWTDQKWGTQNPIMIRDPEFGPVRVRAFGAYAFRVGDPGAFLKELVATDPSFETYEIANQLRNVIVSRFVDAVGFTHIPILDMAGNYEKLSKVVQEKIAPELKGMGLAITQFFVENISLPPEVEQALDKRSKMAVLGNLDQYTKYQTAEAIGEAAKNPGGFAGLGAGMGAGVAIGQQMAGAIVPAAAAAPAGPPPLPPALSFFCRDQWPAGRAVRPDRPRRQGARRRDHPRDPGLETRDGELGFDRERAGTARTICQCAAAVAARVVPSCTPRECSGAGAWVKLQHTPMMQPENKEPTLTKAPPGDRKFPCAACGAKLDFNPAARALKCPYCGHVEEIVPSTDGKIEELDFQKHLELVKQRKQAKLPEKYSQLRCTGCGAIVVFEKKDVADQCPYCGTHLENLPNPDEEVIAPEALLPFKLTDRNARDRFQQWIESLWFAPTELKTIANLGKLNGIYVPHWTYDAMTYSRYQGERGEDYTDTETYTDSDGKTQTRSVTKTRWYRVSGEVQHFFDDVLICASQGLPDHLVTKIPPWDLPQLTPFQSEYLSNFKTERYTVDLEQGFNRAKQVMDSEIDVLIRKDIGGDHQRVAAKKTNFVGITFKHVLLPIWLAHYRYRDDGFQILVNARTGKVAGDRPWSAFKIVRLIVLILAALALLWYLASQATSGNGAPDDPFPLPPPNRFGAIPATGLTDRYCCLGSQVDVTDAL
jgi:membrane protease subunit (stomatin/prohibitin family)